MNLKLRFALLFTFFVAIILIVSSGTIYFLYYNYRESEFYERVKSEGLEFHNAIMHDTSRTDMRSSQFVNLLRNSTVYDERVVLMDTTGRIKYRIPDSLQLPLTDVAVQQIKNLGEYYWYTAGNNQHVGLLLKNTGDILVASGYDKPGFEKLSNLRIILMTVLAGALIITAFMSFIFVREAFIPLRKLSVQMNQTTLQNMAQRLPLGGANSEINDIAKNFNAMLDRLTAAFEFQKSFVFHASHEFRTPLATMLSETEAALGKDLGPEEYKQVLLSLKEEQQELIELTNSLLLISQSDEISYTKDWPLVRIDEVLYDTISHAKKMFPRMTIDLAFGLMPDNPEDLVIKGNESLLRSVFVNLVKNAYMYSIDQKVSIVLESAGETILVHFDNTGTQLPADEKENIMNPFFRGGNALKTKGYGLGLAIVYRFISIHRGTITYTPIANDVNRFTITLATAPAGA
jgi:signal transduction histidine kinase